MVRIMILFLVFVTILGIESAESQQLWVGKDGNIRNVETRAMVIDGQEMYLATRSEIYRSKAAEEKWESIFSLPSGENEVTCLAAGGRNILVGTRRGLFRSRDGARTWRNVFRTVIPEKNNIVAIELSRYDPGKVLIVTLKGVFLSEDSGDRWKDISCNLKNKGLRCAAFNKNMIYVAGEGGLYSMSSGASGWERIYVKSALEKTMEEEDSGESIETEEGAPNAVNSIFVNGAAIYAGIGKAILHSEDSGKSWRTFNCDGLSGIINHIIVLKNNKMYCATGHGIYEFNSEKLRWIELYNGLKKSGGADKLVEDGEPGGSIWAVTAKGLYRLEPGRYAEGGYADVERNLKTLKVIFDGEPQYAELQKAAMRFAEVDPEKITKWRNEARLRALLPKVSLGVDKNRSTNSEIYTSASKDYIIVGPDDESNGLDVSVSWELGDLIWSDDQTNIDVRSRLTTQLRNDILDDLRRAYYERKRLQFELMQSPPADTRLRFEKEMRVRELTQAIDDLTGNYLSDNMETKKTY
jgi:photosystem II stability/assembly factor-like uncharacterized protein